MGNKPIDIRVLELEEMVRGLMVLVHNTIDSMPKATMVLEEKPRKVYKKKKKKAVKKGKIGPFYTGQDEKAFS